MAQITGHEVIRGRSRKKDRDVFCSLKILTATMLSPKAMQESEEQLLDVRVSHRPRVRYYFTQQQRRLIKRKLVPSGQEEEIFNLGG